MNWPWWDKNWPYVVAVLFVLLIVQLIVAMSSMAAEPPTEPGKYELTEVVDTTFEVSHLKCCRLTGERVTFYVRHIDTVQTWTRIDEPKIDVWLIEDSLWGGIPLHVDTFPNNEPEKCPAEWVCTAPKAVTLEYKPCPGCGK